MVLADCTKALELFVLDPISARSRPTSDALGEEPGEPRASFALDRISIAYSFMCHLCGHTICTCARDDPLDERVCRGGALRHATANNFLERARAVCAFCQAVPGDRHRHTASDVPRFPPGPLWLDFLGGVCPRVATGLT